MTAMESLGTLMVGCGKETISDRQREVCMSIMQESGKSPEDCEKLFSAYLEKSAVWPSPSEFRELINPGAIRKAVSGTRPISTWWGSDGAWGGDGWGMIRKSKLIETYVRMARNPFVGNRQRVQDFADMCQERGILLATLRQALAMETDTEMEEFAAGFK
jgi:hypothetical protein